MMFRLIAVIFTLLALSVSGLPTDNTEVGFTNISAPTIQHDGPVGQYRIQLCDWYGAPEGFYMEGVCNCWQMPPGVDHHYFDLAIAHACDIWTGGIGDPVDVYGLAPGLPLGRNARYEYPRETPEEEGRIALTLQVNRRTPDCVGPFPVSRQFCYDSFRATLDACNTHGVDNKHGGVLRNGPGNCLQWVTDPNPAKQWPYYGYLDLPAVPDWAQDPPDYAQNPEDVDPPV